MSNFPVTKLSNTGLSLGFGLGDEFAMRDNTILLDILVQPVVASQVNAPAAEPAVGTTHLVGIAPTGVFAGQANKIAHFGIDRKWHFFTGKPGWKFWNIATSSDFRMAANGTWAAVA